MKKIFTFLLVCCIVSTAFAGPRHRGHCPPPRARHHSFMRSPVRHHHHRRHHHHYKHSMHTRDWIGLGAFILGTSIIANAVERQPTVVYQGPTSHTVYQNPVPVVVTPSVPVVTPSAPVVVAPSSLPPPPPIIQVHPQIYYHRTLSAPPYGVIVRQY